MSNKTLLSVCAIAFAIINITLVFFVKHNVKEKCFITISNQKHPLTMMSDEYLSVGLDTSQIVHYETVNFSDAKLIELASALSPGYLRLGGTMSDRLIFSKEDVINVTCDHCPIEHKHLCASVKNHCKHNLPFFIMTGSKWSEINEFCKAVGVKMLFTMNVLIRNHNGWNEHNAKELVIYSKHKSYNIDFQLGNEPNSFRHVFNISINPEQLAQDFAKLRALLDEHGYKKSLIVGPDTTRPQPNRPECLQYMVEFLGNGSKYIGARGWHQYYLNGREANLNDFWDINTLNLLNEQIETMTENTRRYNDIPMWLTETSSAYGGGAPDLSNSYAGSPLWIDKLGLAAKSNIKIVVRQSLIGGNYSLLDKNFEPLPDFWISLLYKKLVGKKVLDIECECSIRQRLYAHCTKQSNLYKNENTITIFGVNLEMRSIQLLLNGSAITSDVDIDEYIVSAPSHNRMSKTILLNGFPIYYQSPLPELLPRHYANGKALKIPPYSIGFWVIKNVAMEACSR